MIRTLGQMATMTAVLSACATPPAGGQATGVEPSVYGIAPEQVAPASRAAPPQVVPPEPAFIEVSGSATVDVPTDLAQVAFAMETRAPDAARAASDNAAAMDRVLVAIRGAGLPGLDLETFGYQLQPQYSTNDQRVRSIDGYAAFNNVRATIGDVDQVGRLIDVAVGAGANRVASISFSASDVEPARSAAVAEAVRNARAQAEAIAEALGYELGTPLEVRGGADRPTPRPMMYAEMARASQAAPTPIEASDQTVSANVTIRFALGPVLDGR